MQSDLKLKKRERKREREKKKSERESQLRLCLIKFQNIRVVGVSVSCFVTTFKKVFIKELKINTKRNKH